MPRRLQTRSKERPGRPFADPVRDTRAQLLNAATDLFAEQGVAATSFSTIARRAGLTPAMVHYHFQDRDRLIDAVVEERLVPFIEYVWHPVQPGDDPADLIRGIVRRLLENIESAPWVPSTWMREILNQGGLLRGRLLRRLPLEKVQLVGHAIARAQSNGAANPDLNPTLVVFSTLGLVMLHMATLQTWSEIFQRPVPDITEMQKHITGLLLHGLDFVPGSPNKPILSKKALRRKP